MNTTENVITLPLREELQGMNPYGAPQLDVAVALNVNENPYSVPQPVIEAITQAVRETSATLNRYPDRDFLALRKSLARYLASESNVDLPADWLWAANGSNEVISQIFAAFGGPGHPAVSATPTYSMYPEYARNALTELHSVERCEDFTVDTPALLDAISQVHPAIVLLASPNNPTGTHLAQDNIVRILDNTRNSGPDGTATLVVIDEAYAEFRRDAMPSATELLSDNQHLIVTRTMSKAFAMAGLRLGYLAAHPKVIEKLMLVRLPYHLSALTQAVALAALDHADLLQSQVAQMRRTRDHMVEQLRNMGLEVAQSDTNFVLFGKFIDRQQVWQDLLKRGVLIRVVGPAGWLRVSVGTETETEIFLQALKEVRS